MFMIQYILKYNLFNNQQLKIILVIFLNNLTYILKIVDNELHINWTCL